MAGRLCVQCHLEPKPEDLPSDRWPFIVKWMGHYLGHETFVGADRSLIMPQFVPEKRGATLEQLDAIEYYFVNSSKPELSPEQVLPDIEVSETFQSRPFYINVPPNRMVSSIKLDGNKRRIYLANASGNNLLEYEYGGRYLAEHKTAKTQAVGIHSYSDGFYATLIGDMFALEEFGAILHGRWHPESMEYRYSYPLKDYVRLAHVGYADINGDEKLDFLCSGFGSSGAGAFSVLFSQTKTDGYHRTDLISHCGSISSCAHDFDSDGDLDILVLTTQGFHDLWLFTNLGEGDFVARRVWKKGPSTGSTSMHLADLDNDGVTELIITAGNNFEMLAPPVRPYHGVYVYKDTGDQKFQQAFFSTVTGSGCCKNCRLQW